MRGATILENNIVQTAGSAGESIAFGVGVTMPAIMILGFDLEITRVMLVAVLGGLLGILMMIPLRRALIVKQHGLLKYPEGTACAEVLKAGATDEERAIAARAATEAGDLAAAQDAATSGAKAIFTGFGIGFVYYTAMKVFYALEGGPGADLQEAPSRPARSPPRSPPTLLGVGYIIGPRIASIMCAGGVLAYLVLIPAIKYFGERLDRRASPPGTVPISAMGPERDPRRLRALHRRRRGGGRRHHQPVPLAAHDLARPQGRARRLPRPPRRPRPAAPGPSAPTRTCR